MIVTSTNRLLRNSPRTDLSDAINPSDEAMRGADVQQPGMFSYVSVEDRVPRDHPIRKLRVLVDTILKEMDALLGSRYAAGGRESIPPERLLRALCGCR